MAANNEKRVVPWMSMKEWSHVHRLIHSESFKDKSEGLSQIILWKARVPKLPAGLECTLYLMQAILRDEELKGQTMTAFTEHDLKLMYASGIIRFINIISHLGQVSVQHQPITNVAENLNIPDWLVGVRHEATHGRMPSLGILRPGARYAMNWLKENYWNEEGSLTFAFYSNKNENSKASKERQSSQLLCPVEDVPENLSLAVQMYGILQSRKGPSINANEITDPCLRTFAFDVIRKVGAETVHTDGTDISVAYLERVILEEIVEESREVSGNIPSIYANEVTGKLIANTLLGCNLFCHFSESVFENYFPIFKIIHDNDALMYFIYKLTLMATVKRTKRDLILQLIKKIINGLSSTTSSAVDSYLFHSPEKLQSHNWISIVKEILKEPTNETWGVVSSLLDLQIPPVDTGVKDKLADLLRIYLHPVEKHSKGVVHSSKIYTVDMFDHETSMPVSGNSIPEVESQIVNEVLKEWTLSTEHNWSDIFIGQLLNNAEGDKVDELKGDWKRFQPSRTNEVGFRSRKQPSQLFNWDSLPKKRKKRGGLSKDNPVL